MEQVKAVRSRTMNRSRIRFTAVLAAGSLSLISACAAAGNTTVDTAGSTGSTSISTETSASAPPNAEAPAALQFSAPAVGGGSIDFTQYAGQTVVLWFWAPT